MQEQGHLFVCGRSRAREARAADGISAKVGRVEADNRFLCAFLFFPLPEPFCFLFVAGRVVASPPLLPSFAGTAPSPSASAAARSSRCTAST